MAGASFTGSFSSAFPTPAQLLEQYFWMFAGAVGLASFGYTIWLMIIPVSASGVILLGGAVVGSPGSRPRYLNEIEELNLLRLAEQVSQLAAQLDRLAFPLPANIGHSTSERLASPAIEYGGTGREPPRDLLRRPRPPLPDPRLVHKIIRQRRLRDRYFESELFADPAWDILLDLTAARAEHRRVSVTSLCIAAAVPATTALRWIAQMTEMRILVREQDGEDKRRAFIALSDSAADAMARYFDELGRDADKPV